MEGRQELFGHVLRARDLSHFQLTETSYVAGTHLPQHRHSRSYFSLVLRGAYQEVHDRHTEDCFAGTVIFHPENEIHENVFPSAEATCLNLHPVFTGASMDLDLANRIYQNRGPAVALFQRIYRELSSPDPFSNLIMDGLGLQLLGEMLRSGFAESRMPRWLKQVEERLHSSFQEKVTIESLAASVDVHPVHLSRTFHKHYHCTIGEYLRYLRMESACRKLSSRRITIAEIALESGFSDQSAFAKTFKRTTGYSPAQYRKRFQRS